MRRFSCGGRLRAVAMLLLLLVPGMVAFSTVNFAAPSIAQAQDDETTTEEEAAADSASSEKDKQKNLLSWFLSTWVGTIRRHSWRFPSGSSHCW